ncbi:Hypothetical_protein [Hexamita inflata]|uniref:Hypothetical_protein n=1 Tax=Hexamita inflata TaxID=28002 RepID=A0AA86TI59_9EUKA|nr:Hypothetical protein HINF_LOCUS5581 [Hexamita inflata]
MSFAIITNEHSILKLAWQSDDIEQIELRCLNQEYSNICIDGVSNNEFQFYEVFRKTQYLTLTRCLVDLSKFQGGFKQIQLNQCTCIGNFSPTVLVNQLSILDSVLKINQLLLLQLNYLDIQILSVNDIDFYNCNLLSCTLNNLSLANITINLSTWSGAWNSVYLENITFINSIINPLSAKTIDLCISASNNNSFSELGNIQFEKFYVFVQSEQNVFNFDLKLANKKRSGKTFAQLDSTRINLNEVEGNWDNVKLTNCEITGNGEDLFDNSAFQIIVDERSRKMNLTALFGIKAKVKMQINNQNVNLNDIYKCNQPKEVILTNCVVDMAQASGIWQVLTLNCCKFKNIELCGTIHSKFVNSNSSEYEALASSNIIAESMIISSSKVFKLLPKANNLTILNSTVDVCETSDVIDLTIKNCVIKKFSAVLLPKMTSCQIFDKVGQQIINNYLQFKKKNVQKVDIYNKMIDRERKYIGIKRQYVKQVETRIYNCLDTLIYQLSQVYAYD